MKRLFTLLGCLLTAVALWAVKADPRPFTGRLADGRTISVYFHGDEDFAWYTDAANNVLTLKDGVFQMTGLTQEQLLAQSTYTRAASAKRRISMGSSTPKYFPHTGSPRALVILVQFPNRKFCVGNPDSAQYSRNGVVTASTKQVFNQYLNAETGLVDYGFAESSNVGSVRQYFNYCSGGAFTPQFDVVGPVTVSKDDSYYGAGQNDNHITEMMREACALVDDSVDFTQYATNGLVYFIYSGYSASVNGNPESFIWPKSGSTSLNFDNVTIGRYGVNNELNGLPGSYKNAPTRHINGIGLFCHEFSHTMGLPDLYPTVDAAKVNNQEPEYWDLMDGGEYTHNGTYPTPYSPWEKEVFGWTTSRVLENVTDSFHIAPGDYVKVNGPAPATQYLMLQNIPQDRWHQGLNYYFNSTHDAHGLLVWRINYPSTTVRLFDYPNNTKGQPGVAIVPADSAVLSVYTTDSTNVYLHSHGGDLFPGTTGLDSLTASLNRPNYNWITSGTVTAIDYAFRWITLQDDGTLVINYNPATGISRPMLPIRPASDAVYSLDGRLVGHSLQGLVPGIYIQNGRKILVK